MGSYKGSGDPGLARGDLDLVVALVDDGVARVVRAVARDRVDRGYVHLAVRGHDPRRPTVVILGGAGRRGPQHPVLVEGGERKRTRTKRVAATHNTFDIRPHNYVTCSAIKKPHARSRDAL